MLNPKCPRCDANLTATELKSLAVSTETSCSQCNDMLFNMRRRNLLISLLLTAIIHFVALEHSSMAPFDQALLVLISICVTSLIADYLRPNIANESTYSAQKDISVGGFLCIINGTLIALALYHANTAFGIGISEKNMNIFCSTLLWLLPVCGIYILDRRK